jgi:molybdopterin converting factor small subunit
MTMRIRLLAFASAGDALGAAERTIDLEDGSTVADLRARLARDFPALEPLWPRLAIAVNGEIARPETRLHPDCEAALLPPVSGG